MIPIAEFKIHHRNDFRGPHKLLFFGSVNGDFQGRGGPFDDGENEKQGKFSPKVHAVCLDSGKILDYKTTGRTTSFSLRLVAGADGYILERKDSKDGEFTEVARTESGLELTFKDKAPSHFKSYLYRVRSYRSVKEELFISDGSEEITVKTK